MAYRIIRMLPPIVRFGVVFLATALCGLAYADDVLRFRVLLNDKEIGYHSFRVSNEAGRQTIDIQARFDVTFLAIPVYRYEHSNREEWSNGCLHRIAARTDDNGRLFMVDGAAQQEAFTIATADRARQLDAECVMTFAYWNRDFLRQSRLLNAQTGEYLPVEIEFEGKEALRLGEGRVQAQRYRVRNADQGIDIVVWYRASSGKWLSLESRVGKGKRIRYLPATGDDVLAAGEHSAPRL